MLLALKRSLEREQALQHYIEQLQPPPAATDTV